MAKMATGDGKHVKSLATRCPAELVEEAPSLPPGVIFEFNKFWLKTVEPTLKIEQNGELQRRLSLRLKENVQRLKDEFPTLCTNGSQGEINIRLEELKNALIGVRTKTCKGCLDELASSVPRLNPLVRYSGKDRPGMAWFASVSNLLQVADLTAGLLWTYGGDCRGAARLDGWTLNILDLWRREFRGRKWFDSSEVLRQIFEERVALCYDSESSYVKIACEEHDLEKDYIDPRIEGPCCGINNPTLNRFLKLLERPPQWALAEVEQLAQKEELTPQMKKAWLSYSRHRAKAGSAK